LRTAAEDADRPRRDPIPLTKPIPITNATQVYGGLRKELERQRRTEGRVQMETAIDFWSESNFYTGFATDISQGGIFIATVSGPPMGRDVDLQFSLPEGRKLRIQGTVRWVREANDRTPEIFPGVGVQFLDLHPEIAAAIRLFVAIREPLFYPESD
jgi:uncharacterized protein (TIGR02266 family)